MIEFEVKFISELMNHAISFSPMNGFGWLYRGQSDIDWDVQPKAGRPPHFSKDKYLKKLEGLDEPDTPDQDLGRLNNWLHRAKAYEQVLPNNRFEKLALAQHYGLATRLLDWTSNPLVSFFFACNNSPEKDGAIYCYLPPGGIVRPEVLTPGEVPFVCLYMPPPFDRRIFAQSGLFTCHPPPYSAIEPGPIEGEEQSQLAAISKMEVNLCRLRIPLKFKPMLLRQLDEVGINFSRLFPDFEGLSKHVNFETRAR